MTHEFQTNQKWWWEVFIEGIVHPKKEKLLLIYSSSRLESVFFLSVKQ